VSTLVDDASSVHELGVIERVPKRGMAFADRPPVAAVAGYMAGSS